ncbi:MAG: Asp-tRNA(Asn)/Glu-tRNA(Gln) amidotransferase subunit GatB [Deltaproteobacteria bacterium]|nr:Asp-tRNA(Asn)/Glu-tRNA(Gln) amidotransferase subunit GatB [Deltaproteobacteria bacterium]
MNFETVIGLEVHAQLKTASKLFCACATAFGAPPNSQVCPVCMGMPGILPVLNRKAVEFALRLAVATDCQIAPRSVFARKNYFYPDLPKGYQISQYELPLAEHGHLKVQVKGQLKQIGITRIHLEDDAGKLIHDEHKPTSYVDLNRCGVPLIEIVSEPDMRSPEEAVAYLKELREMVRYLEICDGNMEEGSFRCDANISLRPMGQGEFGTRTELKNMNSFRSVQRALEFEVRRQRAVLESGGQVIQETRLYDALKNETSSMRGKEEAHDYRYFPDPDLVPVEVSPAWVEEVRSTLPELPEAKRQRFAAQYSLPEYDAGVLTASREVADYFETAAAASSNPKAASNWIMTEVLAALKGGEDLSSLKLPAQNLGRMIKMIDQGDISGKMAKEVLETMFQTGQTPEEVVQAKGLKQISDSDELSGLIDQVLADNPDNVAKYKAGKTKLLGFFVGQVMQKTKGQANPKLVNEILRQKLGS